MSDADPAAVTERWHIFAAYAHHGEAAGVMLRPRWVATVRWLWRVHGLAEPDPEAVYRPDLAAP